MCGRNALARLDPFGIPIISPKVHETSLGGLLYLLCWAVFAVYAAFVVTEYVHPVVHTETSYIPSDSLTINRATLTGTGAFEQLATLYAPFSNGALPSACFDAARASEASGSDDIVCSTAYTVFSCPNSNAQLYPGPSFAFAANTSEQLASSRLQVSLPLNMHHLQTWKCKGFE